MLLYSHHGVNEGKGKVVDLLTDQASLRKVRYQGEQQWRATPYKLTGEKTY